MTQLRAGEKTPFFEGINQNGEKISLNDYSGKKVILYFYPKDDTPACTAESCNLNENYNVWLRKGFEVVGVSPDSVKSHRKFADKFGLKFNLIADVENQIIKNYGVWGEKSMFGRKYMGVLRTTFVIDENGMIQDIFEKVNTKSHTSQILETLNI